MAFVVSSTGMAIIDMTSEFRGFASERGIRDPFKVSQELFSKRVTHEEKGVWSVAMPSEEDKKLEPTREEKDAYIRMRNEYVAERIFHEIGYNEFAHYVINNSLEEWSKEFYPCDSVDGQCCMDCAKFPCNP